MPPCRGGLHDSHGAHHTRGGTKSFGGATLCLQPCIRPAENPSGYASRFFLAGSQTDGKDDPRIRLETVCRRDLSAGYTKYPAPSDSLITIVRADASTSTGAAKCSYY